MKAMRLFDYLLQQKNLKPTAAFLSYKDVRDNKWESYTYQETYERVLKAAQLLLDAGIQPNDKVALIQQIVLSGILRIWLFK